MIERNLDAFCEGQLSNARSQLHEKLAARKAHLTPAQTKQFEERMRSKNNAQISSGIPRQPTDDTRPLSFSQERVWFLQQLDPADRSLIRPVAVRLTGELNVVLLEQSLTEISRRYEILRATFDNAEGSPQQRIAPVCPIKLHVEDCSDLPVGDRDLRTRAILKESVRELFNLITGPILRGTLVRLGMKEHVLLLVTHHIVFDAWSSEILIDELFTVYGQLARGSQPNLPALTVTYADYAHWQRQQYEAGALDDSLAYWVDTLRDLPDRVELPTDRPRQAIQASVGACERLCLRPDLVRDLESLARTERTTLFSVLLAAFAVLIQRYTGTEDFLIGTPVAGRGKIETENLIGPFVNTLVLRYDLSGDPTAREIVGQIRETVLNALEHQDVPFEKVVEAVHPNRELGRAPLFDVMFNLENVPLRVASSPELTVDPYALDVFAVGADLSAEIRNETDGALMCEFAYRTNLFDRETIQRALVHYQILLSGIADDTNRPISALPMLPAAERHRLLVEWNTTTAPDPEERTLHGLFERAAAAAPQATAVVCGDTSLTYGDLNERANHVAHYLRELGVQPDELVGVLMHRSTDLIVGLLGILKAGAAYLPLDYRFPSDRLRFMAEDAAISVLLTQSDLEANLSTDGVKVLRLDDDWPAINRLEPVPNTETRPEELAYVIYTSGSTGRPKGVMITHRNVVGFLDAFRRVTNAGPQRVSTNVITYAFDTSVEEIFSPLCYGGTLHVVPYEITLDGRALANYVFEQGINTAYIVPDLLPSVAETFEKRGGCGALACLITGLAPKKQSILQRLRNISPALRILNAYGPTEVTYGATVYEFESATDPDRDVPIGRPFPDYQIYIVNDMLEPVPIGVTGEILIGGIGVSRGYLNEPDLTEERFIPNPFNTGAVDRVFRTGDLGRYLDDGTIEFLGRGDRQVKIRGHRIELREIELAVESHPQVAACCVTTCTLAEDDVRLAAYVVWTGDRPWDESALRQHLQQQLPSFMLPSVFVSMNDFPLLPTGKIDLRALPEPDWGCAGSVDRYVPPTSETEKRLAEIWEEVLKLDRVGSTDDFFDLGGHSLLAVRVINRIEEALNVRVPIRIQFERPTIAELALFIDNASTEEETL